MQFADDNGGVVLVAYRERWPGDFAALATGLGRLQLADAGAIEHIGSTSIPGLLAKDVIDIQVRVASELDPAIAERFLEAGYRQRTEQWNHTELTRTGPVPKLVFAPPAGERPSNIHVRHDGTTGARDALLFRDFLRADGRARDAWADFKRAIVTALPEIDLPAYGQIKQPAWNVFMRAADCWAEANRWHPPALVPWTNL